MLKIMRKPSSLLLTISGLLFMFPLATQAAYSIKTGDTLQSIAKKTYGTEACWPLIAAVPENRVDYLMPLVPGMQLTLPDAKECTLIRKPVLLSSAKVEKVESVAELSDQPWDARYLLLSTYVYGYYRTPEEFGSEDRLDDTGRITDGIWEWYGPSFNNGPYPMGSFLDTSGLGVSSQNYAQLIVGNKTDEMKAADAAWDSRIAPYSSSTDPMVNGTHAIVEKVAYRDGSKWGFGMRLEATSTYGEYLTPFTQFFIYSSTTEPLYHADRLTLLPNGDWALRYQRPDKCVSYGGTIYPPQRWDACSGPWFIRTNHGDYGPYYSVSPPIPTTKNELYYIIKQNDDDFVLFKDGEFVADWRYLDSLHYRDNGASLVYRARLGDQWYVVTDNKPSKPWDYIDQLMVNQKTGSVFYRARDTDGKWYMVKNGISHAVAFEPSKLYMNAGKDEVFALRYPETENEYPYKLKPGAKTTIATFDKSWSFDGSVSPSAADSKGNVLFGQVNYSELSLLENDGKVYKVCSSSDCNYDFTLWLNDKKIGTSAFRMVPLYSSSTQRTLPFFYEGSEKLFKYYGTPISPAFDAKDNLVFYSLDDAKLYRLVFSLKK